VRNGVYWVENPSNKLENFADKWEQSPQRKTNFFTWLAKLKTDLDKALVTGNLPELSGALQKSFGSKITTSAFKTFGEEIHQQRKTGNLFMAANTGLLGSMGTTQVKRHTFYGEMAEVQND